METDSSPCSLGPESGPYPESDGDSGRKKCKRGYDGVYGGGLAESAF